MQIPCAHLNQIAITTTDQHVCEDCVKIGDAVAPEDVPVVRTRRMLRLIEKQTCDKTLPPHLPPVDPVHRAGESWIWCYVDEVVTVEL